MKSKFLSYAVHIVLSLGLLVSCIKPYNPDTKSIDPIMIVEGFITDQPGPYAVNLTYTANYTFASLNLLVRGATVTMSDNAGNSDALAEIRPGVYQTSRMQGIAGRTYKLTIRTTDGKVYESTPELLKPSPPINKLYYEYQYHPYEISNDIRNTWEVYLDTKDPETKGDYYRWQWRNYEQAVICTSSADAGPDGYYLGAACCTPCWDINRCYVNCLSLRSDVNVNGNVLSRQHIMSVPFTSYSTYYVEVEQQSLSEGAYRFFNSAQKLVDNTGGIFDSAPLAVGGNIKCTSDPNTLVFGYFGAMGVSVQALKVDRTKDPVVGSPVGKKVRVFGMACAPCENSIYRTTVKPRWWDM